MEFKGTKGEWIMTTSKKGNHFMNVSGNYEFIKVYSGNQSGNVIRQKANALLISKSPQILEKLQESTEVIKWYMENSTSEQPEPFFNIGANQIEQNEQLIKQATEL
ncbi:hypothetical protein [Empedobacter brevis]|uniref:hypothetical protein n=1 Tax=Empedobacter brevis TaxID=247 RepID=UPI00289A9B63|nr:hypothetical protein [Empedobacter brevis]